MTGQYAKATTVSSEKSRAEIERVLLRYGASHFMYGTSPEKAVVAFEAANRRIKFELPMPDRKARDIQRDGRGSMRTPKQIDAAVEQATRQRWRALLLVIKAKLEAVEAKITTFEQEFLAHIMLPDGQTVGDAFIPRLAQAYESGEMPSLRIGFDR